MADRTRPVDSDDDVYTIEEFLEACENDVFTDYDGMGEYAKDGQVYLSEPFVFPSVIGEDGPKPGFTHVIWYNK